MRAHQGRNNVTAVATSAWGLGTLSLEEGGYPPAEQLLLKSLDICRKGGNVLLELWVLPVLSELYLKMGRLDKAAEHVTRGFELLTPGQNWYGLPAPMYLAKGMLATTRRGWDEAERSFETAVEINRWYQLPWDEAKTLYEWGLMHVARSKTGDRKKAQEKLGEAFEIFQRVGAKKDVEKVLAATETLRA